LGLCLDWYRDCRLCPRECRVDRTAGQCGYCGETAQCRVASRGPHFGEEPSFTGTKGSGTIFFSGCACRCFFCQNHQISGGAVGTLTSIDALETMAFRLVAAGVHNINLVTPDHFWPHVHELCCRLRATGVTLPLLYNSSGYARAEVVAEVADAIDILMPDFKFADPALAERCMGDRRYPELALASIRRMVERRGFLQPWDTSGEITARQGVLVRHLVLPGEVQNSLAVVRRLHEEFSSDLPLSIMSQFLPTPACSARGLLNRRVHLDEYQAVCDEVAALGFERVYTQPELGDDEFMPDFTQDEPFAGNRRR